MIGKGSVGFKYFGASMYQDIRKVIVTYDIFIIDLEETGVSITIEK